MMSPPTDNLYKFCAISGLIIFFFSFYYPFTKIQNIQLDTINLEKENEIFNIDNEYLQRKIDTMKIQIEAAINENLDDLAYVQKYPDHKNKIEEIDENIKNQRKKQIYINKNVSIIKKNFFWLDVYNTLGIFPPIVGVFIAIYGFAKWHKTQKMIDEKLKNN